MRSRRSLMLLNASMMSRVQLIAYMDVNTEQGERLERQVNTVVLNVLYAGFGAGTLVCGRIGGSTLVILHCGSSLLGLVFTLFLSMCVDVEGTWTAGGAF